MANDTKALLLKKGYELAKRLGGVHHLTTRNTTAHAGVYHHGINHHYGGIAEFRRQVLEYGVKLGTMSTEGNSLPLRMSPGERRNAILAEAYAQAVEHGIAKVTRVSVANKIGVTDGLINRYFKGRDGLREAVLAQGVVNSNADIVADAIELGMLTNHVPSALLAEARKLLAA
jgi:hypothetical protein